LTLKIPDNLPPWLKHFFRFALLASLLYVPVFGYLDNLPIRTWDEARIAVNAYEMYRDGDYIVTHYRGKPEMWNTKPPLLLWTQVFFMKLIGPGELAIRLPSAIAVFGTCMALLFFSIRYLRSFWFGFISVLALITSEGYMNVHAARTGDYDAMLTFFTTLSSLFLFSYTETSRKKFLYLFFIALTLGAMTKGVAALLFSPAWLIWLIVRKKLFSTLRNPHLYAGLFIFLVTVVGYYLMRESRNPGYIATVQENELGGRFLVSQGNQGLDFWFYFDNFITFRLTDRYFLIPCGMLIGLFCRDDKMSRLGLFSALCSLIFFILISTGQTRLFWYDVPLYPFISMMMGFLVYFIYSGLKNSDWLAQRFRIRVIPSIFLFLVLYFPYHRKFKELYLQEEHSWDADYYAIGHYLQDAVKGNRDISGQYLVFEGYSVQNEFYLLILQDRGVKTGWKPLSYVQTGDHIITYEQSVRDEIKKTFVHREKPVKGPVVIMDIGPRLDTYRMHSL
jgi:4-amino-4-deoxy-L-arabinose transferase-like glycosyltransferase